MEDRDEPVPTELVELYRATGLSEAYALKTSLAAEGVPAFLENELLQGAVGEVPLGWHTAPRISVQKQLLNKAQAVLQDFLEESSSSVTATAEEMDRDELCLACGAPMEGAQACRECGWSWDSADTKDAACSESQDQRSLESGVAISAMQPEVSQERPVSIQELGLVLSVAWLLPMARVIMMRNWSDLIPITNYASNVYVITPELFASVAVVVFAINRSDDTWAAFGVNRPGIGSVFGGIFMAATLTLASIFFWILTADMLPEQSSIDATLRPVTSYEYLLQTAVTVLSAFADNLVFSAYLNLRLSALIKSRWKAVVLVSVLHAAIYCSQSSYEIGAVVVHGLVCCTVFHMFRRLWPLVLGDAILGLCALMGWI